jgi:hypothetical protein
MNSILKFIDVPAWVGALLVIAAYGIAGTLDSRDHEIAEAYNTGVRVGVESSEDLILQIDTLCSKEWPDAADAALARSRVCNSM